MSHTHAENIKSNSVTADNLENKGSGGKSMPAVPVIGSNSSLPLQKKENKTGLPDALKAGIESLSGVSMDDTKVHYNSAEPAQLNAFAYAQGTDIHIGPGQEKHLAHEAWHVIQQKQGRVKPTIQMKSGIPVNDDTALEYEADVMGNQAAQMKSALTAFQLPGKTIPTSGQLPVQLLVWPSGTKRPKCAGTSWAVKGSPDEILEAYDKIQELYEWMTDASILNKITSAMTYDEWYAKKGDVKAENMVEFNQLVLAAPDSQKVIKAFDEFKVLNAAPKPVFVTYDAPYTKLSTAAKEMIVAKGMVVEEVQARPKLKSFLGLVMIADEEHVKHVEERKLNLAKYDADDRVIKNLKIEAAKEKLTQKINDLFEAEKALNTEEAAAQAKADAITDVDTKARLLPAFAGVAGNTLALAIWEASINFAGSSGYLEVDTTIYARATVVAATGLLRTFSFAWTALYPGATHLRNPHCPGGGNPQDKGTHSNATIRTSRYQTDFIGTYGGVDTVIHINSDSV